MKALRDVLFLLFGAAVGLGIIAALAWTVMALADLSGPELTAWAVLGLLGLLALAAAGAGVLWVLSALFHVFAASVISFETLHSRLVTWKKRIPSR